MTDREECFYAVARALKHSRAASETQQAADEGHATPENAAKDHEEVAGLLEGVIRRLETLRDLHNFDAKRMQRAARIEARTGVEFRRGGGEAA